MQLSLAPGWIADVAQVQPGQLGRARRRAPRARTTPTGLVVTRLGLLAALLLFSTVLATRAFRAYQHSI